MKKNVLIFLLFVPIFIFAEENISDNRMKSQPYEIKLKETRSHEVIDRLPDSDIYSVSPFSDWGKRGYYNIALGFAQIGDFKSALKYAKKIDEQRDKDDCYFNLVLEMVASGLEDEALKTVKKIKDEYYNQLSYKEIINSVVKNNHEYEKAMLYANKYQDEQGISSTKLLIIFDMLNSGNQEKAIEFYQNNQSDEETKNITFNQISAIYIIQDDLEGLNDFMKKANISMNDEYKKMIISQATRMNKTYIIDDMIETLNNKAKDREYANIACGFIRKYKYPEAYEILAKIHEVDNRDKVYFQFAQNYIKDRNTNKALSYEDSLSTVKMRDRLYRDCARSFTKSGYIDGAIALLQKVNDINHKEVMSSDIAINLFKRGDIEKYEEIIGTISDVKIIDDLYRQIINNLLKYNKYEQIEEYIEKITTDKVKDSALCTIAMRYSRSNDYEKALKYAERIINDDTRNRILENIKVKQIK